MQKKISLRWQFDHNRKSSKVKPHQMNFKSPFLKNPLARNKGYKYKKKIHNLLNHFISLTLKGNYLVV